MILFLGEVRKSWEEISGQPVKERDKRGAFPSYYKKNRSWVGNILLLSVFCVSFFSLLFTLIVLGVGGGQDKRCEQI